MNEVLLLMLVFSPFVVGALFALSPRRSLPYLGLISTAFASLLFLVVIYFSLNFAGSTSFRLFFPWVPRVYVNLSFFADGLSLFYSLLITGMGALVLLYANYYMDSSEPRIRNFYCFMNIFMGAMLGAVLADNFMLFFLFWEVTGVMSYLLIGYHYEEPSVRNASRLAFLITSMASLCLFLGFILIGVLEQTLEISQVAEKSLLYEEHRYWVFVIMVLILIGIYAKSAQFPLHFWLPEAMAAPTPVSAYLHSATMVKLGIYLTARIFPIFADNTLWFPLVTSLSLLTILVGGVGALRANTLKKILAYATISQLGFFISFYGMGDPQGLQYDYVHIFNHALYKGSLFMLVGILAHAAQITDIRQIGGVFKKMPLFGVAFAISIAAMAGIPGTTGFLSKELIIKDSVLLLQQGALGVFIFSLLFLGLLFKVAFSYRLFKYCFFSPRNQEAVIQHSPNFMILLPPLILSSAALVLGISPNILEGLLNTYFIKNIHLEDLMETDLWYGVSFNFVISVTLFLGGIVLYRVFEKKKEQLDEIILPDLAGISTRIFENFPYYAKKITALVHSSYAQVNLLWVFILFSATVGYMIFYLKPTISMSADFSLESLVKLLMIFSTITILMLSDPVSKLIALSFVGLIITFYFVLRDAPDVAMTQMVVEVATLFVFVLLFSKLKLKKIQSRSWRKAGVAAFFGVVVALIPSLNGSFLGDSSLANFFLHNTVSLAKGGNAVNTILVDFRALDTLGEITVVVISVLGVYGLFSRGREKLFSHLRTFIPTPLLKAVIPAIFIIATIFSIYLLVRGHNYPGGGFVGGMVVAISSILVAMAVDKKSPFRFFEKINPFILIFIGLTLTLAASSISLAFGDAFLVSYFLEDSMFLNSPLIFDLGVFILVLGGVTTIIYIIRENTLKEMQ